MSETIAFRLNGDLAAAARVHADRSGIPLTAYIHELVRDRLRDAPGIQPIHIPRGSTPQATEEFTIDRSKQQGRIWIFRDLNQPIVWALPARMDNFCPFRVRVQPTGRDRGVAILRDNLIAWPAFQNVSEVESILEEWIPMGVTPHPWGRSG